MPTSYSNKYESQETSYENKYASGFPIWDQMLQFWEDVEETWDSLSGTPYVNKFTPR